MMKRKKDTRFFFFSECLTDETTSIPLVDS